MSRFVSQLSAALIVLGAVAAPVLAQQPDPGPMVTYFYFALTKGPAHSQNASNIQQEHDVHIGGLIKSGKVAIAGPFAEDGPIAAVGIIRAASVEEAKAIAEAGPAVKAGYFVPQYQRWLGPRDWFRPMTEPMELKQYVFGYLKRGPKADAIPESQLNELQKQHLAFMDERAKEGHLLMAGPFIDAGELRGLVVYRGASITAVRQMAEADPMI
jgi:uncharacterized protein YciI